MRCNKWKDREFLEKARDSCERSPETYREIEDVVDFYDVYPEISALSMWAVRPLLRERNKEVQLAAVKGVREKMERHADSDSSSFSLARAALSGEQVREIINEQRTLIEGTDIQREKLIKEKEVGDTEMLYTCPLCKGLITVTLSKRDKIVSLRVTEDADDAYAYLAKQFDVPRSFLLSELLAIQSKFPDLFL